MKVDFNADFWYNNAESQKLMRQNQTTKACLAETLTQKARSLRRHIICMTGKANSGHPGGSLSAIDILTCLYFHFLRHDSKNPQWEDRDRVILSKGHASPALYACLAESGYFSIDMLSSYRQLNSPLQGHPSRKDLPGVEISTGSVGQGLSVANGIALAGKLDGKSYHVYAILGDGECQEGQIWEAAMAAAYYKSDNLTAIVDRNRIQNDWFTEEIMALGDVGEKFRAFGWNVREIDGHDMAQILDALDAKHRKENMPTCIVAHTVKGKGVSFMENNPEFHGKAPTPEQVELALRELNHVEIKS